MADLTPIDFDNLTYRKSDLDQKFVDANDYTDTEVAKKIDKGDIGGSNGIPQLLNGKIQSANIQFATSQEATNGTRDDVTMNPLLVKQETDQLMVLINDLDTRLKAIENP